MIKTSGLEIARKPCSKDKGIVNDDVFEKEVKWGERNKPSQIKIELLKTGGLPFRSTTLI